MLSLNERSSRQLDRLVFWTKVAVLIYTMLIAAPWLHNRLYFGKKLFSAWMLVLSLTLVVTNRRQYRLWEYLAI